MSTLSPQEAEIKAVRQPELPDLEADKEPVLLGGEEGEEEENQGKCYFCYTKGPCGCIFMTFFMILGLFCWAIGFVFRGAVCIITCPCPGSTICNCCADLASWMISIPAKMGKCIAGACPC
mmetsp:Transcript_27185/g.43741  ORF Transcript_27185/g.43741 Transcript_27185/m.43741 type:complete len:121 (+) Transcript_27185:40-402(+)